MSKSFAYWLGLLWFGAQMASAQSPTGVLREVWTGVPGITVNDLRNSPNFSDAPLLREVAADFTNPVNWADNYGVRMRAWLTPQTSGNYTFWVAGDDNAELWLSTDDTEGRATRIARTPSFTNAQAWNAFSEQKSAVISLVAGQRYYIEALMKETSGGDHLAVAWALAPSTTPVLLSGSLLTPFQTPASVQTGLVVEAGRNITQYAPNLAIVVNAQALDISRRTQAVTLAWSQVSGSAALIKTPSQASTQINLPAAGTYVFRVTGSYTIGTTTTTASDTLTVTVLPKLAADAGSALAEYWFNIPGRPISALTTSMDFPRHPHGHRVVTSLTLPLDVAENFGARVRGFILPPTTGSYRFFVAGNETAEFRLSTDATAANLQLRGSVSSAVGPDDHFISASQDSGFITLTAGRRYAFELLTKEESGSDHTTVIWQQPGQNFVADITTEYLAPPADAAAVMASAQEFRLDSDYVLHAGRDQCIFLPQRRVSLTAFEWRRISGSDVPVRTWSKVSGPGTVTFAAPGLSATTADFSAAGIYVLRYTVATQRNTTTDDVKVEVKPAISANHGWLTRQVWWNKSYATTAALKVDTAFPGSPDMTDTISEFRQTNDWADYYGTRVTGILTVPGTGTTPVNYTFYCAGSDAVEFAISTDATSANLRTVCFNTASSGRDVFTAQASQTSAPIALRPGSKYFVELIHKEQTGSDYFSVAWSPEGDRRPQVLDGSLFEPSNKAAAFSTSLTHYAAAGTDRRYWWPHDQVRLAGTVLRVGSSAGTPTVSWRKVSGPTANFVTSTTELAPEVSLSAVGSYVFELAATLDGVTHTDTVTVTVLPGQTGVTGYLTRSVWLDVLGRTLADITNYDADLSSPHLEDLLPGASLPMNWTDYTGTRLSGTVTVPVTGRYSFWITADDVADLRLDLRDGNGLQRLAWVEHAEGTTAWDAHTYQRVDVDLTAGTAYSIQVMHKEESSGDHCSIAFSGPATNGRELLSRGFLTPARLAPLFNPEITVGLGYDRSLLWPNSSVSLAALVYDLKPGPQAISYRWSSTSSAVSFDAATSPVSTVRFSGPGIYEIKMTATDGSSTSSDTLLVTVKNPLATGSGGIIREAWTNVSGARVSDLKASAAYAGKPTYTDLLPSFDAPPNWGDNYGQRLTATLQVATEADYVFLIAGDDECELWFNSTGETETGATRIASTPWATSRYQWTANASQRSAAFRLLPGRKYFIQAFQKEGGGDDHLAVAYRLASQTDAQAIIIPGSMLSPLAGQTAAAFDGQMSVEAGENQSGLWPKARYTLRGSAVDFIPGPQAPIYRWSVLAAPSGQAAKVIFDAPTALTTGVEFPAAGTYQLQLSITDGLNTRTDSLSFTLSPALAAGTGSLLAERWNNITGSWVTDLTRSTRYPGQPDTRYQLRSTEIPSNTGDNYGLLIRGYLHAPTSGVYRFNLASDEWSEAYLSIDRTPENKAMLCFVPAATDYYEWRKYPDYQLSRPVALAAGQSYYFELRYKESGWRDHLALAWLRPGTTSFEVIDGAYTSPFKLGDATAPTITLTGGSDVTLNVGQTFADPGFAATDGTDGDLTSRVTTEGTVDVNTPGTYFIRYTVTDAAGNVASTAVRKITVAVAPGSAPIHPADTSGTHSTTPWAQVGALTDMAASRFLKQASFGPNDASIARVKSLGIPGWITEQLSLPATLHLPQMERIAQYQSAREQLRQIASIGDMMSTMPGSMMPMSADTLRVDDRLYTWWSTAVTSPDQLRQRVAFALSEVLVISDQSGALRNYPRGVTNYYDILVRRAFGNYRDILEEITLNPMMGIWLTMVRSNKTQPDENYAREIMQLFSIGLEHLNRDGTYKRDASGNAIPTYTQAEINELARAFTGWTYGGSRSFSYVSSVDQFSPMMSFEDQHDRGSKVFLSGSTIPAGQTAPQDLKRAIDIIFNHPNVGPFLARRLIQRLVTSNPSPAYIYRVSSKFDNNGSGVRGDLGAVVRAILLDPEARTVPTAGSSLANGGKLSEPILRVTRLLRALPRPVSDNPPILGRYMLSNVGEDLGQSPFQSPTVFNFFHVDYQPPGPIGDAGLFAPEFETSTELVAVDSANYFFDAVRSGFPSQSSPGVGLDLAPLIALVGTPDAFLARLETLLLARPMSASLRSSLQTILTTYASSPTEAVQNVLGLLAATPEFTVDR